MCVLANSLQKHCTLMPSEFKMSLLLLICQEKKKFYSDFSKYVYISFNGVFLTLVSALCKVQHQNDGFRYFIHANCQNLK